MAQIMKLEYSSKGLDTIYVEDDGEWYEMKTVVSGQWLKALGSMPPEVFGKHACSVCDHFAPNDYHGKHEFLSPICPYCGAKMDESDGKQNGNNCEIET